MNTIIFHDHNIHSRLVSKKAFKLFLFDLFKKEKTIIERVNIIFCSDKYLLSLNKKFLGHDYYTDTLTFVIRVNPLSGDIYISVDRVKENAKILMIPYTNELWRVIIHSCLHLCGYDDKPKTAAIKMEKKQEAYLKSWLVSRETQIGASRGFV